MSPSPFRPISLTVTCSSLLSMMTPYSCPSCCSVFSSELESWIDWSSWVGEFAAELEVCVLSFSEILERTSPSEGEFYWTQPANNKTKTRMAE